MDFKAFLESIGDSIVCVADDDVVKVHVHTNDPGLAIQKALKYGALSNMKIDNMRLEHQEKLFKLSEKEAAQKKAEEEKAAQPAKEVGFLAVSVGDGLSELFKSLGVDYIIEGGQTMNPSTADILDAVDKVNAKTIFVLPNNKNIILAANQAAELMTDKELLVIPTKTIPQGITAVINFVPELSVEENEETMLREIKNVKTGQVTYAVRDTVIDDKEIKKDDFMGIGDQGIVAVGTDMVKVTRDMIAELVDEDSELISIYYGCDVAEDAAEALGSSFQGQKLGTFGDYGILSFNGNKIITSSGGGMLLCSDEAKIKRARFLATQARDPARYYQHSTIGYNYRMSNVVAGIGRGQLLHLEEHKARKNEIYRQYKEAFADIEAITMNPMNPDGDANNWLSCMTIAPDCSVTPDQVMDVLAEYNIETRPIWKPMHLQPVFADCDFIQVKEGRSVSEDIFNRGVCLPSDIKNTPEDMELIISLIRKVFEK